MLGESTKLAGARWHHLSAQTRGRNAKGRQRMAGCRTCPLLRSQGPVVGPMAHHPSRRRRRSVQHGATAAPWSVTARRVSRTSHDPRTRLPPLAAATPGRSGIEFARRTRLGVETPKKMYGGRYEFVRGILRKSSRRGQRRREEGGGERGPIRRRSRRPLFSEHRAEPPAANMGRRTWAAVLGATGVQ